MTTAKSPGFPSEIKEVFDKLREDVMWLFWKLELYRDGFLNPGNRAVLFQAAAAAFTIIEDSVAVDISITLGRMTDPPEMGKNQNLSFPQLFKRIEQNGTATILLTKWKARYESLKPILEPLSTLRNKVLAHRDLPVATAPEPLKLPLTPENVGEVCEEFSAIMNEIEGHFADSTTLYKFQVAFTKIDSVVRHVKRGLTAFEEDRKNQWGEVH